MHLAVGAGVSAAVGVIGRTAEADVRAGDGGCGSCYTYSCSKGLLFLSDIICFQLVHVSEAIFWYYMSRIQYFGLDIVRIKPKSFLIDDSDLPLDFLCISQ